MSEMINKVAEALCYAKPVTFEDMARVAITAMREPTTSQINAGRMMDPPDHWFLRTDRLGRIIA